MNKKKRKPKKLEDQTNKQLEETLWKWFSKYIKKRDKGACFTCPSRNLSGRNYHAGHFISRRFKRLKFDEDNVHGQCARCNVFLSGNLIVYRNRMIKKYGTRQIESFESIELKQDVFKLDREWLIEKINHYKRILKDSD